MKKRFLLLFYFVFVLGLFAMSYFCIMALENGSSIFLGQNGSPEGSALYNLTNTFQYNGDNTSNNRVYEYFDTGITNSNLNYVYNGSPQITVLTHGLSGGAYNWSNENNDFSYDVDSIISRIE